MSDTRRRDLRPLFGLLAAVFGAWLLWWLFAWWAPLDNWDQPAAFGDSFGAINALFAGLAFAGIIYTILQQREELAMQREVLKMQVKELALQREEVKRQADQLEAQGATFRQQAFDSTFFQMLAAQRDIVRAMRWTVGRITNGHECFDSFWSRFASVANARRGAHPQLGEMELIEQSYKVLETEIGPQVQHYFRHLYQIMKFVDRNREVDRRFYSGLVRAQLSHYESLLLFYFGLTLQGRDTILPLIRKYALLKHVDRDKLINRELHMSYYGESAFAASSSPNAARLD